jgi:CSLREA domain-containing protein
MKPFPKLLASLTRPVALLALLASLLGSAVFAAPAFASPTTFVVTKTADTNDGLCNADCSLREAISAANANAGADTITLPAGTYQLTLANAGGANEDSNATGDLDINDSLTINGAGSGTTIIEAGTNTSNGIDKVIAANPTCASGLNVTIDGVTVRFGRNTQPTSDPNFSFTGGGIDWCAGGTGGTFTLSNSVVSDNTNVNGYGGGLNVDTVSSPTTVNITNVAFSNNQTLSATETANGGAINLYGDQPTINITDSTFTSNHTTNPTSGGGAIYFRPTTVGHLSISGSTFTTNTAPGIGGAIATDTHGAGTTVTIQTSTFTGNTATASFGGAIDLDSTNLNTTPFSLTHLTITGNTAGTSGGGVYVGNSNVTMSQSRIVGNTAPTGKGIRKSSDAATATVTNNWWGCSTGPGAAPCDTATTAGGTLTFNPWYRDQLTATTSPVAVNQSTSLTASFLTNSSGSAVSVADLAEVIGRSVTWAAANGNLSSTQATVQAAGTATGSFQATSAGTAVISAKVDNDNTSPVSSNVLSLTVNKANTTAAITNGASLSSTASVTGQPVTVTYSVTGAFGNSPTAPTGNVTVSDGTDSCTATVAAGQCDITFRTAGSKTITATYVGDTNFNASPASTSASHTVNKADTTTTITSDSPDPSVTGQTVTFNVTVAAVVPGAAVAPTTITGSVTVSDGGTNSCIATLTAGSGSCDIAFPSPASYSMTGTYGGDSNFNGSASATNSHTVNKADTTTTITSDNPDPSSGAQSVTVNYTVSVTSPGAGTLTGNVTVTDGVDSCIGTVAAGTCSLTLTTNGARTLTATYAGDSNFNGSASIGTSHSVDTIPPSVTINQASGQSDPTNTSPINFTVIFSEPVTGFATGDVTLGGTAGATTGTVTEIAPNDGTTYNVAVSGMTGSGNVIASITSGKAQDGVGNPNNASTSTDNTVTYDATAPTVTNITSTSANGSYNAGAVIPVTVTFSEPVTVIGTPQLTLETGATDEVINYTSGSGTTTLTFTYTVQAGDTSADLDYVATTSLALNGGTIKDAATNDATLTLAAPGTAGSLGFNKAIVIDTTAPTVTNVTSSAANGTYGLGAVIPVTIQFSEPVTVTGTPQLTFETGATDEVVNYTSGSGTSTLTFTYTAQFGDVSPDLDYVGTTSLALNGGTISDAATNNATLTLPTPGNSGSLSFNKNIVINATNPVVTNVTSTAANGSYTTGALIPVTVTFSSAVTVTGTPQLTLETGATDAVVNYTSGSGTNTLTFNYTVVLGNNSLDLDYVGTTSLALNGGTIQDASFNDAILTLPAPGAAGSLGNNKNIVIDTTAPTVTNVTSTAANGAYTTGAVILVTVQFSEPVIVTGTPQLTLETGATDEVVNYTSGSGTDTLTFNYTVQAGDTSADLDYKNTSALALNGGTIKDAATNNATLTLATPGAAGSLGNNKNIVIDTTAPTVTNVTSTSANGSYNAGAVIPVTVTFSEPVTVIGIPQLTLETGATDEIVNYTSGSGTATLTFTYTVQAGDTSADLDYVGTTSLALNGGTIKDAATNDATLTLATPGTAGSLGFNKAIAIDNTAPTVTLNQAAGQSDPTTNLSINFTAVFNEPVTGFTGAGVNVSGTAGATTATVTEIAPMDGTTYNVAVSGMTVAGTVIADIPAGSTTDLAGNGNNASTSADNTVSWSPDLTPPDTSIDSNPSNPTNSTSAAFTFSGTDNITPSGSLTFQCDLDGSGFSACSSPQNYSGLSVGSHTFQVRAVDQASNADLTPASFTWVILSGPIATVTGGVCTDPPIPASGLMSFQFTNPGGNPLTLHLASNSNPNLVKSNAVKTTVSGSTGTVSIVGIRGRSGIATITLNLSDGISTNQIVITFQVGTVHSETLNGTSGIDWIFGMNGSDTINGNAGDDLLCGGSGNDTLNGGTGNDFLNGRSGNDILNGGDGNDSLLGTSGVDTLTGGAGADFFSGGLGVDILTDFNPLEGDTKDSSSP